jgi:hypothetical protein
MQQLRRLLTGIAPAEEVFLRSGFRIGDGNMRTHLESIGRSVAHGFRVATAESTPRNLTEVSAVQREFEGFAYAGAGMGLAIYDAFLPQTPTRVQQLIKERGSHRFLIHLGAGWAVAGIHETRKHEMAFAIRGDDVLRWVPLMGFGAHQVYFHWTRYVENRLQENWLSPRSRRTFDEGVGCALWLGEGGSVQHVSARIADFQQERQVDLWAGLGFICAYAGITGSSSLDYLRDASGPFWRYLAEGAAHAGRARHQAGISTDYTDLACQRLCGMSSAAVARLMDEVLQNLPSDDSIPHDEAWRNSIRSKF